METKKSKVLIVIIAIGLLLAVATSLLTGMIMVPSVTEQDFHYSATYRLGEETNTVSGVYRVRFDFTDLNIEPWERYYLGEYVDDPSESHPGAHTIAKNGDLELCIAFSFNDSYLMGDGENDESNAVPYLVIYDREQVPYEDRQTIGKFNAELISWEMPQPIENNFVFRGFSLLHNGSMIAMLVAELLLIIACMIFVKRDKTVSYKVLDKVSVVLNYLVVLIAIPLIAMLVYVFELTMSTDSFIYQMFLCIPAFTALTVAVSMVLRRQGFTKSGFFIQLAGPVLFVGSCALDIIYYNLFM